MNSITGAQKKTAMEARRALEQAQEAPATTEAAPAAQAEKASAPKGIADVEVQLPDVSQREARVGANQSVVDFGDTGGLDAAYQQRVAQGLAAGTLPAAMTVFAGQVAANEVPGGGDPTAQNIVDFGDQASIAAARLAQSLAGDTVSTALLTAQAGQVAALDPVDAAASRFLSALEQKGVTPSSLAAQSGRLVAEFSSMGDFDKARDLLTATRQGTPTFDGVVVDWRIAGLPPGA